MYLVRQKCTASWEIRGLQRRSAYLERFAATPADSRARCRFQFANVLCNRINGRVHGGCFDGRGGRDGCGKEKVEISIDNHHGKLVEKEKVEFKKGKHGKKDKFESIEIVGDNGHEHEHDHKKKKHH